MPIGVYDDSQRARGVDHGLSKLTEDDIRRIRKSDDSATTLAKEYGVHFSNICYIRRRITWRHVR